VAKIAIVEDENIVALDIRSFLGRSGYAVVGIFSSGEELLQRFPEIRPDLVLMDIKIRGRVDGVETARLVHDQYRTPVVLLTAFADDETIARAKITQPFGYIIKPFEERELKTAIEIALYRAVMERRLMESEERYRHLFQEGISGNFLSDAQGKVLEANPAFRALAGLGPLSELPALADLVTDRKALEILLGTVASGGRIELNEIKLRSADGRDIVALANAAPTVDGEGRASGIRGELIDITEKRRLEDRLILAQKMEDSGRLAGGIAHDFNNILTAILGYSNLLADELPAGGSARDDIEGIRKAAARASYLTRQLLAFSSRQPFSPRNVDLNAAVRETERLLRRILPEDVLLSLSLCRGVAPVLVDPAQVEQILLNLSLNARDAMPSGGELRISTAVERIEQRTVVGLDTLQSGTYVKLGVSDSGTGIPLDIIDKIFEPFFTTKPKERGTGLGLSTVYGIARQLGGAVEVSSVMGKGASFSVWIPVASIDERRDEEDSAESPWPAIAPATVLFVDDDDAVRALASRLIAKGGHRVFVAANAGEALLIAESVGPTIDLLVTDVVMPFLDGYGLAKRLSESMPSIELLFISGHAVHVSDEEGKGEFLAKPFSEVELAKAVTEALLRSRRKQPA
jgi:PAS domain S-box-containing protein